MTIYRERLWPAAWLYFAVGLIIPAALLALLPINLTVGIVAAILLYVGIIAALVFGSPVVEVTDEEFRAGRAHVPLSVVGAVEAFTGDEASAERGVRLDARAWLMIRGSIGPVVKVHLVDERDPTPYWIVSTRRPERIVEAIAATKRHGD
jgi:hypothetical protein